MKLVVPEHRSVPNRARAERHFVCIGFLSGNDRRSAARCPELISDLPVILENMKIDHFVSHPVILEASFSLLRPLEEIARPAAISGFRISVGATQSLFRLSLPYRVLQ